MRTSELRSTWREFECAEAAMMTIPFGPDRIRVAPPTADAWTALATVMRFWRYGIRTSDTDSYNCRAITGGSGRSLHSYGIALDVNWTTNPFFKNPETPTVRYSPKATQRERALDVKHLLADTDMLEAMIVDVRKLRTGNGSRLFQWGGDWRTIRDAMHFQIDVPPDDMAAGVDWTSVRGAGAPPPEDEEIRPAPRRGFGRRHMVDTPRGLWLRAGPGLHSRRIRALPRGWFVFVVDQSGDWSEVKLTRHGAVAGYMASRYLSVA